MPQLAIAAIAALVIAAGAYGAGWKHAQNSRDSEQLHIEQAAQKAGESAAAAAVNAIEKIEVRNVTIRQNAETVTREVPVYRDCVHDQRVFDGINQALTEPRAGQVGMPTADTADR